LRRCPRHVENITTIEEEMVCICEQEIGRNINDEEERLVEDIIDFQEGNEKRLMEYLIKF
jgi:uncharacterized cupin superfamily protein